jgi:ABC-type multidrug transport system fused ATPase/permease subunit
MINILTSFIRKYISRFTLSFVLGAILIFLLSLLILPTPLITRRILEGIGNLVNCPMVKWYGDRAGLKRKDNLANCPT